MYSPALAPGPVRRQYSRRPCSPAPGAPPVLLWAALLCSRHPRHSTGGALHQGLVSSGRWGLRSRINTLFAQQLYCRITQQHLGSLSLFPNCPCAYFRPVVCAPDVCWVSWRCRCGCGMAVAGPPRHPHGPRGHAAAAALSVRQQPQDPHHWRDQVRAWWRSKLATLPKLQLWVHMDSVPHAGSCVLL